MAPAPHRQGNPREFHGILTENRQKAEGIGPQWCLGMVLRDGGLIWSQPPRRPTPASWLVNRQNGCHQRRSNRSCDRLRGCQFADVRDVAGIERADQGGIEREECDGVAIVADKLDFVSLSSTVDEDGCSYIAREQSMRREVAAKSHGVKFFDCSHDFGNGCAVTNLGTTESIYHALRIFNTVPSGEMSGPSTT